MLSSSCRNFLSTFTICQEVEAGKKLLGKKFDGYSCASPEILIYPETGRRLLFK